MDRFRKDLAGLMAAARVSVSQAGYNTVCDMLVDVESARLTSDYHGETVYFCAAGCKRAFDKDPERYLIQALRQNAPADAVHMPS